MIDDQNLKMTQANDTTTKLVACLIINTYKLIGIDLRKQQAFNADPKEIQKLMLGEI